jgi:transmembrane sensor
MEHKSEYGMLNREQYGNRIIELARKWREGTLTPEEREEFEQWYEAFDDTRMPELSGEMPEVLGERMYAAILEKGGIRERRGAEAGAPVTEGSRRSGVRGMPRLWRYGAVAAAVLLLVCGLALLYVGRTPRPSVVVNARQAADTVIVPGGNKAVLTLANGRRVILDSARNGLLAMQGTTGVIKRDNGAIGYERDGNTAGSGVAAGSDGSTGGEGQQGSGLLYNTVATPRGGQYLVTLPDGTRVWLNAASSIRFPTTFTGGERRVEISGEAYLEVVPDKAKPFRVAVEYSSARKQMEVEVLGTQFNVMAYEDEGIVKTTLLEGAVRLVHGAEVKVLRPGEQGQLKDGIFQLMRDADTSEVVAWKNGQTLFASEDLTAIMRKVSRWYDVDVAYRGELPKRNFTGGISRKAEISQLFKILELNHIHFTVEGRKITLMP